MRHPTLAAIALFLLAPPAHLGCSLDGSSSGTGVDLGESAEGPTTGEPTTGGPASSSDSSTGAAPSSTTDESGSPESSSSTGASADQPAELRFRLDDDALSFGPVPVGEGSTQLIVMENVGELTASTIEAATIEGPFSFPRGFPGSGGNCGDTLAGGGDCLLAVRFGPSAVGPALSSTTIAYYDGVNFAAQTSSPELSLEGAGQGTSDPLLINGDAEAGDMLPWDDGLAVWSVREDAAFFGTYGFVPSGGAFGESSISQTVDLSQLSSPVAGLRYAFDGRARSVTGAHQYAMYISFDGQPETQIGNGATTDWALLTREGDVPPNAASVRIRAACTNAGSGACSIAVDELDLRFVYP